MSKKLSTAIVSALLVASISIFSIANAFALTVDAPDQAPLTSPVALCAEATANLNQRIDRINAFGLSTHQSNEQIQLQIKSLKSYWRAVCAEAEGQPQPLTSALDICRVLGVNYKERIANIKAFGLSLHQSNEEIQARLSQAKYDWVMVCREAGVDYTTTL